MARTNNAIEVSSKVQSNVSLKKRLDEEEKNRGKIVTDLLNMGKTGVKLFKDLLDPRSKTRKQKRSNK